MDNHVILAVAGSGKTTHLVNSIDRDKSILILTYTDNNHKNLKNRIASKFGAALDNVRVCTYFTFLYSFCLRPLCGDKYGIRGINFNLPPESTRRLKRTQLPHYFDRHGRIYSARMASFIINFGLIAQVRERLSKYFDRFYVDEIQDFAGYDFNLLAEFSVGNIDSVFVGDFFQHTYDTSRDGNINSGLYDDLTNYKKKLEKSGFHIDEVTLGASYRCSSTTCKFVSTSLGIPIDSRFDGQTKVEFLDNESLSEALFHQSHIVKLFYQSHLNYGCFSENWGASKGMDSFDSVCVVLNKNTEELFRAGKLSELSPITRNKLYVACTRARSELLFVPERFFKKFKGKQTALSEQ